jgi:hypothetical protein
LPIIASDSPRFWQSFSHLISINTPYLIDTLIADKQSQADGGSNAGAVAKHNGKERFCGLAMSLPAG